MLLSEILAGAPEIEITGIKTNSKEITPGDAFLCTMGITVDRHDFIEAAAAAGAVIAITSKPVSASIPTYQVADTNAAEAPLFAAFFGHPEQHLDLLAITGTDGKTSVSAIVQTLIGPEITGNIGTNGYSCGAFSKSTNNTTPAPNKLYEYFAEFLAAGCRYVCMEASSEALYHGRLAGINYHVTGYTNITSEHLNVHKTVENYVKSKLLLFSEHTNPNGVSVLNTDDKYFDRVKAACRAKVVSYGRSPEATLQVVDAKLSPSNTKIRFKYDGEEFDVTSPMLAEFNISNLACAMLMVLSLGLSLEHVLARIGNIDVSGRLDMVDQGQDFFVMVDYAHTPNGITKLLEFVRTLPDVNRSIVVIGQAGERDATKRHTVGKIVADGVDKAIFTSEDPRREDPHNIVGDMVRDLSDAHNYEVILDRAAAIRAALAQAEPGDMVMILGKGNETYQAMPEGKIPFNDLDEVKAGLSELQYH